MNKAERKFRLYAILVLFVLLTVMLAVINGINFTMAARDADLITEKIAALQGTFDGIHSQTPGLFPPGTIRVAIERTDREESRKITIEKPD